MSKPRLSRREEEKLVARALREHERRAECNRAAAERRAAAGRCRIELWVPAEHVETIRQIARGIDAQLSAGGHPRLRFIAASSISENPEASVGVSIGSVAEGVVEHIPPEGSGLGARARKRLQNQRARARKKAAGQKRVSLEVATAFEERIKGILRDVVPYLVAGDQIELDPGYPEPTSSLEKDSSVRPPKMGRQEVPRPETGPAVDAGGRIAGREEKQTVSPACAAMKPTFNQKAATEASEEEGTASLFHDIQALDRLKL